MQQKSFQNLKNVNCALLHQSIDWVLSGQNKCTSLNYSITIISDHLAYLFEHSNGLFCCCKYEETISAQDIREKYIYVALLVHKNCFHEFAWSRYKSTVLPSWDLRSATISLIYRMLPFAIFWLACQKTNLVSGNCKCISTLIPQRCG